MIQRLACSAALLATIASTAHAQRTAAANCAAVRKQYLTDVKITEAVAVAATRDSTTPVHVAHCRVAGTIGKEIRFVALLPDAWNGKFFMGGGGGYVGSVDNSAIGSVDEGYASVGTDAGHQGSGIEAKWALGHPIASRTSATSPCTARPRRRRRWSRRTTARIRSAHTSSAARTADGRR